MRGYMELGTELAMTDNDEKAEGGWNAKGDKEIPYTTIVRNVGGE